MTKAVYAYFDWIVPGKVAKAKGKEEYVYFGDAPKPAANSQGFSTGYRLKNTLEGLSTEEGVVAADSVKKLAEKYEEEDTL